MLLNATYADECYPRLHEGRRPVQDHAAIVVNLMHSNCCEKGGPNRIPCRHGPRSVQPDVAALKGYIIYNPLKGILGDIYIYALKGYGRLEGSANISRRRVGKTCVGPC